MIKGHFSTIFLVLSFAGAVRADHTTCPPNFAEVGRELSEATRAPAYSTRPAAGFWGTAETSGIPLAALPKSLTARGPGELVSQTNLNEVRHTTHLNFGIGTEVAVKRPLTNPENPAPSAAARVLLANENSVLGELARLPAGQREYFPKVVEAGADFIATEWHEGRTLRELINSGQVDSRAAAEITGQLRRALEAVHSVNLVHGDVKPENIVVLNDGRVKLLDFGNTVKRDHAYFSAGTTAYAHPEQAALKPAAFSHDWHSFGLIEAELAAHARPAPSAPESYQRLADYVGLDLARFGGEAGFDWRKFYSATRANVGFDKHIPPELLPELERLEAEHGKLFSARDSLAPSLAAEKNINAGPLADGRPFPRRFDRYVHALDRSPLPGRAQELGRVTWESGGKKFAAEVLVEASVPANDLINSGKLEKYFRKHLEKLPAGSKIKTVKSRIYTGDDVSLAKFESHLVETPDGKRILVFDKAFTDLSAQKNPPFDPVLSDGVFGRMQSLRALLRDSGTGGIDEVRLWDVQHFDTVKDMHEAETRGGDPEEAHRRAYEQSLMARFSEKVIRQLGLQTAAPAQITGGNYEPISTLTRAAPVADPDSPLVFVMPTGGEPVKYQDIKDSRLRRQRNRDEFLKYRRQNPSVDDSTPVYMRFDVRIPVRPTP